MKLTILGNNGPYPSAGGACSGYLIREGSTNLLIDCGNGILSNLQKFIRLEELDAVILTHLHSDHMSDMLVLKYFWQIKRNRGQIAGTLKVFAPPEPVEEYKRLDVKGVFDLRSISRDSVLDIGGLRITFEQMTHPVMDLAVSLEAGGRRFVFSGDTSWTESIIGFAKNAHVLMLDSGLMSKDKKGDAPVPHLTSEECGIIAARANVGRLLLTHFWPEYAVNDLLSEARANFPNVQAAEMLKEFTV